MKTRQPSRTPRATIAAMLTTAGLILLGGCQSGAHTGAMIGAGAGGALGAVIGERTDAAAQGAALGAAAGAGMGYLVGNEADRQRIRTGQSGYQW